MATRLLTPAVGPSFSEIAVTGKSVNWLALAMREQAFALGVLNKARAEPDRRWLSNDEFQEAKRQLLTRFAAMGLNAIFDLPEPLQVLFLWQQLGDAGGLRALIADAIVNDEMFIKALNAMRSWANSSDRGYYQSLSLSNIGDLLDVTAVHDRLIQLANAEGIAPAIREGALSLLEVWNDH
jgi:hypothetical protein